MPRYIDADTLAKQMQERCDRLRSEYGDYDHYTSGYDDALDEVEDFPSADVVPRSDVAKIFDEFTKMLVNNHIVGYKSHNGEWVYHFKNDLLLELAELKKKYTGEGG